MSAAILAMVLAMFGGERAFAQTAAPIVYARGAVPAPASANVRFSNNIPNLPPSAASTTLAAGDLGPIDLTRPGAPVKVSYGPALPAARLDRPAPTPLAAKAATPVAMAEPYAGPPYQVEGKWYVPTYEPNYDEVGIASWYGPTFHGKASASGEVFDENAMTAAHPTLPIPSLVRVTNLENGKQIVVRLNDRGPFVDDRIIDLSRKAGEALDLHGKGTAKVRVQYVGPASAAPNSAPSQPVQAVAPLETRQPAPMVVFQKLPPLAPAAPAQAARLAGQNGYFLQAGSFADLGNAHRLRDQLRGHGQHASVTAANVGGSEYYRVMVGPWASRVEAERAQASLAGVGAKSLVVAKLD